MLTVVVIAVSAAFKRSRMEEPAARDRSYPGRRLVPWFLWLFVGMVLANSVGLFTPAIQGALDSASRGCLVVAIAALGMKTSFQQLARAGWGSMALILAETVWLANTDGAQLDQSAAEIAGRPAPVHVPRFPKCGGREVRNVSTVTEQREFNVHARSGIGKDAFFAMREARDATLDLPALMLPSVQVSMRGGALPQPESNDIRYLEAPLDVLRLTASRRTARDDVMETRGARCRLPSKTEIVCDRRPGSCRLSA